MTTLKIQLSLACIAFTFCVSAQTGRVGIGTTNPQAKLEVAGGKVRFSDYGTNTQPGNPTYALGVEADGDIIELPLSIITDVPGLQFYSWGPLGDSTVTQGDPGPAVIDINDIHEYVEGGAPPLGPPDRAGLYTGSLFLSGTQLNPVRPNNLDANFIVIFTGTLIVQNTGDFTFNSNSDDGSRIFVDEALILEDWVNQGGGSVETTTVNLAAGRHDIEFWYYQEQGVRTINFSWGANPDGYALGSSIQANQFVIE